MRRILLKLLIIALLCSLPKIGGTNAFYSDTETSSGNQFSAGCWTNPEAVALTTPASGSLVSTQDVTFAWAQAISSCPLATLYYNFQIFSGLTLIQESGWTTDVTFTVNDIPDGAYWWQVLAKDQFSGTSTSSVFTLTVDRTVPTATLTVANSPAKTVENRIINGNFSTNLGGWTTSGDVVQTIFDGKSAAQLGKEIYPDDVGKYVWENRLMQSFQSGVKNLALDYNVFTNDYGPFDDPGFLIRLNGEQIFSLDSASITNSSGWQHFDYDLSGYPETSLLNLAIYAGNTQGLDYQSWAYVTNITTNTVTSPSSATYNVIGTSNCFYNGNLVPATGFKLTPDGLYTVNYNCVSASGVDSGNKTTPVTVDSIAPATISDLFIGSISQNAVNLTWTPPVDVASYDLRYWTGANNFDSGTKVSAGAGKAEVLGLNPNTLYYFAIKSADAAPNWSDISDVVSATTLEGATVNEGDIVINELMWMGTQASSADEYLELRNMTDRTISLDGFTVAGVSLSGKSISRHGYFLITNYTPGSANSHLKNSVVSDLIDPSLVLDNTNLQLELLAGNQRIDVAGNGLAPFAGIHDGTSDIKKYYSMERTLSPGDGANALSWYTCIDSASTGDFFTGSFERGTPGAQNRSENEPISHSPAIILTKSDTVLTFSVENSDGFPQSSYELTYDTDSVSQGVIGKGASGIITLGTCSTGGTCVYHLGVKNIHLKVTLTDKNSKEFVLEKDLP